MSSAITLSSSVKRLTPELPEMQASFWLELAGLSPAEARLNTALLSSYAEALDSELYLAVSYGAERKLVGLAAGVVLTNPNGRRVLSVWVPATLSAALWVATGAPELEVSRALLDALNEQCATSGVDSVVLPFCEPTQLATRLAPELGFRGLPASTSHTLTLPDDASYESYLVALRSQNKNRFVRDLRRAEEAGARSTYELSPSNESLDKAWALQLNTYQKHDSPLRFNAINPLPGLARRMGPTDLALSSCWRDGVMLGFVLTLRHDATVLLPLIGHVDDPGFQVHVTVLAHAIRCEIERGARRLLFGGGQDVYKKRVGCTQHDSVHFHRRVRSLQSEG